MWVALNRAGLFGAEIGMCKKKKEIVRVAADA